MPVPYGFGVGDFVAVGQLAYTLYRQCYLVAKGAPQEFRLLVDELTALSQSIRLLQDEVENENSILVRSGEDRVRMIKEMLNRVEKTLVGMKKLADKYRKLLDDSRSKPRKIWDKVKWSIDVPELDGFRNELLYHNGVMNLLLTSVGNSSLQRLESATANIERLLGDIQVSIRKLQNPSTTANTQNLNVSALSASVSQGERKLSLLLMERAEVSSPWNAIGIYEWIKAGRWWLCRYQDELRPELFHGNKTVSPNTYAMLIKASWILCDVLMKHPQLNFLEMKARLQIEYIAKEVAEEFKNIAEQGFRTPKLEELDRSALDIWEGPQNENPPSSHTAVAAPERPQEISNLNEDNLSAPNSEPNIEATESITSLAESLPNAMEDNASSHTAVAAPERPQEISNLNENNLSAPNSEPNIEATESTTSLAEPLMTSTETGRHTTSDAATVSSVSFTSRSLAEYSNVSVVDISSPFEAELQASRVYQAYFRRTIW